MAVEMPASAPPLSPPSAPPPFAPPSYPVVQFQPVQLLPVSPALLASPARRFAGALLFFVLFIATLVVGYCVWAVIAWTKSTTPAKQVLGMRVIDSRSGIPATFGQMVMRQVVWSVVLGIGSSATGGILAVVDGFFIFGGSRQRLLDKMANTLVIKV